MACGFSELPAPGQWIRRRGSDIVRGAEALSAGQALRAQHLGIAASVGAARLHVVRRPRVALFCTGDELAMPGEAPAPGRIFNSNRFVLAGLLEALGCEVQDLGIVPDRLDATRAALQRGGGGRATSFSVRAASRSARRITSRRPLTALGELNLWQIAMKPGKPLAFGRVGAVPFIGLPGNPVSSFVTFLLLVRPFLLRMHGRGQRDARGASPCARTSSWPADPQRREFLRARRNDRRRRRAVREPEFSAAKLGRLGRRAGRRAGRRRRGARPERAFPAVRGTDRTALTDLRRTPGWN